MHDATTEYIHSPTYNLLLYCQHLVYTVQLAHKTKYHDQLLE